MDMTSFIAMLDRRVRILVLLSHISDEPVGVGSLPHLCVLDSIRLQSVREVKGDIENIILIFKSSTSACQLSPQDVQHSYISILSISNHCNKSR
jgi:hypothetical protein